MAFRRHVNSSNNPNEAAAHGQHERSPVDHPDDEMDNVNVNVAQESGIFPDVAPPSIHRTGGGFHRPMHSPHSQQQQQQQQQQHPFPNQSGGLNSSLASKPHAFGGAVLSPDHARHLTTDLALQLASALSVQASHAAGSRGVLPPGENVNLFRGSGLVDALMGVVSGGGGGGGGGSVATAATATTTGTGSVFRSNSSGGGGMMMMTPGTPRSNAANTQPAPHILSLLQHGGTGPPPNTPGKQSTTTSTPGTSTPGTSITGSSAANTPAGTPIENNQTANNNNPPITINPLSLLSTAEALESFASWRTHYTVWITEAWNILKWSEPSAALFWEMATMFHTLYVASLSVRGGGSGGIVRSRVLEGGNGAMENAVEGGASAGGGAGAGNVTTSGTSRQSSANMTTTMNTSATSTGNYIPPLLSCGSQSSMGSVRSTGHSISESIDRKQDHMQHVPQTPGHSSRGGGSMRPARHSAKELPVWLISMFLLVHAETEAFLRCTSGEDERRFSDAGSAASPLSATIDAGSADGSSLDFSALLHHRSLSPRTRLHAGQHQNNANCASFLLRHLRKFILVCAVPRNVAACKAVATLAAKGRDATAAGGGKDKSNLHRYSGANSIDIGDIESQHSSEHSNIGLDIELTVEELDRLHLVLQAPSGGLVDDPPVAIGEHILRCLAEEELELARDRGMPNNVPNSHRWTLMQNGLITVADAERILRRYLEEELTMAKHELDGEEIDHGSSDDVTSRLSKLSLSSSSGTGPLSPSRGRASLATADSTDAGDNAKDSSYLKELSYQKLRSTTVLLEPGKDNSSPINNIDDGNSIAADSQDQRSQTSRSSVTREANAVHSDPANDNARLHDLHVADCSDTHFYLLQPFEHATIAACTDCTIVLGAVAGLLHVVDCERTTITSAARRVVVSNSFDVVHYLFTPSPPLLVGDNQGCQFAPYNTYYEGLREDLLSTGLAAVLRSASSSAPNVNAANMSICSRDGDNNTSSSPGRGGDARSTSPTSGGLATLQCASNKWKAPIELCKLEVPQLPNIPTPGSPIHTDAPSSPGADERALGGSGADVTMKTPVLLPASEFDVLLVPVESEETRIRRQLLRESQAEAAAASASNNDDEPPASDAGGEETAGETNTVYSTASSLTGMEKSSDQQSTRSSDKPPLPESDYCRILADLLTLSPFHMPHDYERRVIAKAERVRTLQQAMVTELNDEQRSNLEEELNKGFQDWLVTSGNLRQFLDLIHLEKKVAAT